MYTLIRLLIIFQERDYEAKTGLKIYYSFSCLVSSSDGLVTKFHHFSFLWRRWLRRHTNMADKNSLNNIKEIYSVTLICQKSIKIAFEYYYIFIIYF